MRIEGFAFLTVTRNTVVMRALPIGFEFKFECLKKDSSERKIRNHVASKVLLFLVNAIIEIQIGIQNQSATLVFLRYFA